MVGATVGSVGARNGGPAEGKRLHGIARRDLAREIEQRLLDQPRRCKHRRFGRQQLHIARGEIGGERETDARQGDANLGLIELLTVAADERPHQPSPGDERVAQQGLSLVGGQKERRVGGGVRRRQSFEFRLDRRRVERRAAGTDL